jgi:hypothetical protein
LPAAKTLNDICGIFAVETACSDARYSGHFFRVARGFSLSGERKPASPYFLNRVFVEQHTAEPSLVAKPQRHLEDYLRSHTEILLD